jgi:hypothetical protein
MKDLGADWSCQVIPSPSARGSDYRINVMRGHEKWHLYLETRGRIFPRDVLEAVGRLQLRNPPLSNRDTWVLGAPYVSERSGELCKSAGLGFVDLAGNCELRFGPAIVSRRALRHNVTERREHRSLVSPKGLVVAAALVLHPLKSWTQRDLSRETRTSLGLVNRILASLAREGYVESARGHWKLREKDKFLAALAGAYAGRRPVAGRFRTATTLDDLEARLERASAEGAFRYALTLESAAKYRAPFAPQTRLVFYVDTDPSRVAETLKLKPGPAANVEIRRSLRGEAFYSARKVPMGPESPEGRWIVNDLLLYLDLGASAARGREQAGHLLEVWNREGQSGPSSAEAEARWHEALARRERVFEAYRTRDWRGVLEHSGTALDLLEGMDKAGVSWERDLVSFHRWRAALEVIREEWDADPSRRKELLRELEAAFPPEDEMLRTYPPYRMNQAHIRYVIGLAEAVRAAVDAGRGDRAGVEHHARLAAANFKVAVSRYTEGAERISDDVRQALAWFKARTGLELSL